MFWNPVTNVDFISSLLFLQDSFSSLWIFCPYGDYALMHTVLFCKGASLLRKLGHSVILSMLSEPWRSHTIEMCSFVSFFEDLQLFFCSVHSRPFCVRIHIPRGGSLLLKHAHIVIQFHTMEEFIYGIFTLKGKHTIHTMFYYNNKTNICITTIIISSYNIISSSN